MGSKKIISERAAEILRLMSHGDRKYIEAYIKDQVEKKVEFRDFVKESSGPALAMASTVIFLVALIFGGVRCNEAETVRFQELELECRVELEKYKLIVDTIQLE